MVTYRFRFAGPVPFEINGGDLAVRSDQLLCLQNREVTITPTSRREDGRAVGPLALHFVRRNPRAVSLVGQNVLSGEREDTDI